ncbi:MAG: polysaccharide biosynthesis/export family protein [Wenzhouxiangella sp.]
MIWGACLLVLAGCATNRNNSELAEFQETFATETRMDEINQQLLALSMEPAVAEDNVYRIGAGDEIRVTIFNVPELSREYRVDANGNVTMPLVGNVKLSGLDLNEAEAVIAAAYDERYLRNPQVSVSVTQFRSQQFTAIGAVSSPRVYNVERRVSLLEAIAMSGGLSSSAGTQIYLTDRIRDPESGQLGTRSLIVDVEDLMQNPGQHNLMLGDSAVINVPRAGSIFVEGAVRRPGSFTRQGDTTVLKAIAMAGGLEFEANRSSIRVLQRNSATNEWSQTEVSFAEIRETPLADTILNDGDIVVVDSGFLRSAWSGTIRTVRDFAILGFRPLAN